MTEVVDDQPRVELLQRRDDRLIDSARNEAMNHVSPHPLVHVAFILHPRLHFGLGGHQRERNVVVAAQRIELSPELRPPQVFQVEDFSTTSGVAPFVSAGRF